MPPTWSLHDKTAGTVIGTFPSRARGDDAAGHVLLGHAWTLWEWGDPLSPNGELVDEGVGPLLASLVAIAHYRIQCVQRPAAVAEHRRHVTGIGTIELDGATRYWDSIAIVRDAINAGHEFYTRYPTSTRDSAIESHDCSCGAETIRSSLDPPAERNLDNVAVCSPR